MPALLVSHGATFYTAARGDPTHDWFTALAPEIATARPRAIVIVSAHFVAAGDWAVTSSEHPPLVHDHPMAEMYGARYSPPGDPTLAKRIVEAMRGRGLSARVDPERGLDHGAWLPLRAMAPRADVPIVMMSVNARASFDAHIAAGRALQPLRREGVLVVASGGVTHNQAEFRARFSRRADPALDPPAWSVRYDEWVRGTLESTDPRHRIQALATYAQEDDYASAHPTPEHFWPVLVATGAAGDDVGRRSHEGFQHGLSMSAFMFGRFDAIRDVTKNQGDHHG